MVDFSFARFYEYMMIHAISMLDSWSLMKDLHDDMFNCDFWENCSWCLALFMMNTLKMTKFISRPCFWSFEILFLRFACVCEKLASDWSMHIAMLCSDWLASCWLCFDCQHINETTAFHSVERATFKLHPTLIPRHA